MYYILTIPNFGARHCITIDELCYSNLTELAQLPTSDLDKSIGNIHKVIASHHIVHFQVRLNAIKCIIYTPFACVSAIEQTATCC